MEVFSQQGRALVWTRDHETVRIEPWGRDSLRVRATVAAAIRSEPLPAASRWDVYVLAQVLFEEYYLENMTKLILWRYVVC